MSHPHEVLAFACWEPRSIAELWPDIGEWPNSLSAFTGVFLWTVRRLDKSRMWIILSLVATIKTTIAYRNDHWCECYPLESMGVEEDLWIDVTAGSIID